MSLLDANFEKLTIINKSVVDDGYGGVTTQWTDGASIAGALVHNTSTEAMIAQEMGATSVYTLTVRRAIELDYHTVFRRESDSQIFRVTSNSDDNKTPVGAGLDMRQYSCERWTLT